MGVCEDEGVREIDSRGKNCTIWGFTENTDYAAVRREVDGEPATSVVSWDDVVGCDVAVGPSDPQPAYVAVVLVLLTALAAERWGRRSSPMTLLEHELGTCKRDCHHRVESSVV